MADIKDVSLALFLDAMSASLANDLEWALAQLDGLKAALPANKELAERYVLARRHLRDRRRYEAACART